MELFTGRILDQRYRIDNLLGEGGRGASYQAYDLQRQCNVAVKILDRTYISPLELQEKFTAWREPAVLLDHPDIIRPLEINVTRTGLPIYIVSEFVPGGDLGKSQAKLDLVEVIQIVRQVCPILDYAHQRHVFHKALKPENILLDGFINGSCFRRPLVSDLGLPPVTDLGLKKLLALEVKFSPTTLKRTLMYLSPEQARDEPVDARTDIYVLGVLLYELSLGQVPFKVDTVMQAVRHHAQVPPPPPRDLWPGIPEQLEGIILKALAKDPDERYQNGAELAEALAGITEETRLIRPKQPDVPPPPQKAAYLPPSIEKPRPVPASTPPPERNRARDGQSPSVDKITPRPESNRPRQESIKVDYNIAGHLSVTPGESTSFAFVITNQMDTPQEIQLSVDGIPAAWIPDLPSRLKLTPHQSYEVRVAISPPRSSRSQEGRYDLSIQLYCPELSGLSSMIIKPITLTRFAQFSTKLLPVKKRLEAGKTGRVVIHNQGNAHENFLVRWQDETGRLKFKPSRERVRIPAGKEVAIPFQAVPDRVLTIGAMPLIQNLERHPFSISVSLDDEHKTCEGEILTRGLVPTRFGAYFVILILLVALVSVLGVFLARPPRIENMVFNPLQPNCNQPFTASWLIKDGAWGVKVDLLADSMRIAAGLDPRGQYFFTEGVPRPYLLTVEAKNLFGSDSKSVRVCSIDANLTVSPTVVREGEPVVVQWNAVNAEAVRLEPFGYLNKEEFTGSKVDFPHQRTTYRLTATDGLGSPIVAEQTVEVSPGSNPQVQLKVEPAVVTLDYDKLITLTWELENADTASIEPGVGAVIPCDTASDQSCNQRVLPAPTHDTVYTLVAQNVARTITSTAKVTVVKIETPKIINFSAEPPVITIGVNPSVTLSWQTSGANSIRIDPDIGEVPPSGEKQIPAPGADTTYTLTAQNGQIAPDVEAVTIKVQAASPPVINSFTVVGENQILIDEDNRDQEIEIKLSWDVANVTDNDQVFITRSFDAKTIASRVSGSTIDRIPAISREVIYTLFAQKSDGQTATGSVKVIIQQREQ